LKTEPSPNQPAESPAEEHEHELLLRALAIAAFLVFFNGYLIAPLIPSLAREFSISEYRIGWVVPAFLLPYGFSTLIYGVISDRLGRIHVLLTLLAFTTLTMFLASFVWSANSLIAIRILGGIGSGGVIPIALAIVGDLYPYKKLGRAMGWIFGAIAGGTAFGATLGAWLNPYIGWRHEFMILAVANTALLIFLFIHRHRVPPVAKTSGTWRDFVFGYVSLLKNVRASRTYTFIFMNGLFHGGVFAWLGYYLAQRYHLTDTGIGKALLGYGIPGIFLGPPLGRLADRFGRRRIIPLGFLLAGACALALVPQNPLWLVTATVTCLSVGFDMSHPLMAGIVSSLDPKRRGQAMGFNAFSIFLGFGLGAVVFQNLVLMSLSTALLGFGVVQLSLGLIGFYCFREERAGGAH
jgi:predicted MFS family arabinose efflux permease